MTQLSNTRVAEARKNENKEIILKDTGSRKTSIDNKSSEGSYELILTDYKQNSYDESNACIWLSIIYLVIKSQDSQLAEYALSKYKKNCKAYEWLRVNEK